ncbi:MAG: hypothetical protein IMX02_07795 [Limnochordaceae bacterium]|nr:hypothetical protein [Limnochordaceae bacterium]
MMRAVRRDKDKALVARGLALVLAGLAAFSGIGAGSAPAARAAEPVKERQVVYGITPWTGKEYGGTFAPKMVDTLFLSAGDRHILDVLETDVYYWPITQEFMADWMGYRKEIPGKLEVRQNGRVVATLAKQPYTFVYPEGYFGGQVQLATGEEAKKAFAGYQKAIDDYYKAADEYRKAEEAWRAEMSRILDQVQKTGKPADPAKLPKAPEAPQPPKLLVMQPSEGYVIDLPAGRYELRVLDDKGQEVAGTRKRLEVFAARRSGVGYQIIPESKWTVPVEAGDPTQALYVSTEATFYLKAFDAREYNRYAYSRMTELSKPLAGSGQQSAWQWVLGEERQGVKLEVLQEWAGRADRRAQAVLCAAVAGLRPRVQDRRLRPVEARVRGAAALFRRLQGAPEARAGCSLRPAAGGQGRPPAARQRSRGAGRAGRPALAPVRLAGAASGRRAGDCHVATEAQAPADPGGVIRASLAGIGSGA